MKSNGIFAALILVLAAASAFGADRALIVGIDHYRDERKCNPAMDNRSDGCITPTYGGDADVEAMERLLQTKFSFAGSSIRTLKEGQATAENIRDSFKNWLIKETKSGDRVFFFYSGHGARVPDDDGDEDDHMDEIIAPFDIQTQPTITNFIRDDEINQWIAALSGRQIVMVFDSCHSGTISRSLKKKGEKFSKYLITENVPVTRGNPTDAFSDVPKIPQSRDLSTVVDKYMANKTPNLVVISAAQAYQQAMWFDADGSACGDSPPSPRYRGALTYLFENIYLKENPTLSKLNNELKSKMTALGKPGTNQLCPAETGYQTPELEFTSAMANQTLWGMTGNLTPSWEQSAVTALQNPLSKIRISLKFASSNGSYRIGETIKYSAILSEAAYLYVVVFSQNNVATVIFPSTDNKGGLRQAGTFDFEGVAQEPLGKDVWVVIASKKQLNGLENLPDNQQFSWEEIYNKIGVNKMQTEIQEIARTRGVGSPSGKLNSSDWQTSSAVMATLPE